MKKPQNVIILALLVLLILLSIRHAVIAMRLFHAQAMVETITKLKDSALSSTNESTVVDNMDYILWFCARGTNRGSSSTLDVLVENFEKTAIAEMLVHLKQITGRDIGNDPKRWIESYKSATGASTNSP